MTIPAGLVDFQRSYEISPIILISGIASDLPGGALPISSLLQAQDYGQGVTNQATQSSEPFGRFIPEAGSTAIDNQIGLYPFANQSVAANAIITQPLHISLLLHCPVNTPGGYQKRRAVFSNLQSQLAKHSTTGGLYNVATPALLYTNCILTSLQDVTGGEGKQKQITWRFDFIQPLLTLEAAQQAQNNLMRKLSAGTPANGDPPSASGRDSAVGNPASLQGASAVPAAQPLAGAAGSGAQ